MLRPEPQRLELVDRRIGGLEIGEKQGEKALDVDRRIGGLEISSIV